MHHPVDVRRLGLVAALGLLVALTPAGTAGAVPPLGCGDAVTHDTVLTADIGPCSNGGLVVVASNVTLDLNGHTIFGTDATGDGYGIRVTGRRGVVIENGTVRDFDTGIFLVRSRQRPTTGGAVLGMQLLDNGLPGPTPGELGSGIVLLGVTHTVIEESYLSGNVQAGITVDESTDNAIRYNQVVENGVVDLVNCVVRRGHGIRFLAESSGNVVEGNTISRNTSAGVNIAFTVVDTLVRNNLVEANEGNAIRASAFSHRTVVRGNVVSGNGFQTNYSRDAAGHCVPSARISAGSGIAFDFSNDNLAEENDVTGNALDGIRLGGGDELIPNSGSVVRGNTVQGNGRNGIVVTCTTDFPPTECDGAYAQGHEILSNVVSGNGGASAGTLVFAGNGLLVGNFDLLDTNTPANDGYPSEAAPCDNNVWAGNTGWSTAFPDCTTG